MSPRRIWDSPTPSLASECVPPPEPKGGGGGWSLLQWQKKVCGLLKISCFVGQLTTKDVLVTGKVRIVLMNLYSLLQVLAKKFFLCIKYYSKFF